MKRLALWFVAYAFIMLLVVGCKSNGGGLFGNLFSGGPPSSGGGDVATSDPFSAIRWIVVLCIPAGIALVLIGLRREGVMLMLAAVGTLLLLHWLRVYQTQILWGGLGLTAGYLIATSHARTKALIHHHRYHHQLSNGSSPEEKGEIAARLVEVEKELPGGPLRSLVDWMTPKAKEA